MPTSLSLHMHGFSTAIGDLAVTGQHPALLVLAPAIACAAMSAIALLGLLLR